MSDACGACLGLDDGLRDSKCVEINENLSLWCKIFL
jgi:hypothetical protein